MVNLQSNEDDDDEDDDDDDDDDVQVTIGEINTSAAPYGYVRDICLSTCTIMLPRDFIDVFSSRATGFHRQAKL